MKMICLDTSPVRLVVIRHVRGLQRTLGQTYRDRQSKQQNISDSLATRSTLFSKYGAPSMDVWKAVLVSFFSNFWLHSHV